MPLWALVSSHNTKTESSGYSILIIGMDVRVNAWLSFSSAIDWWPSHDVPHLSLEVTWNWLQHPCDSKQIRGLHNRQMDEMSIIHTGMWTYIYIQIVKLYIIAQKSFLATMISNRFPGLPHKTSDLLFSHRWWANIKEFSWLIYDYKCHPVLDPYWVMKVKREKLFF